MCRSHCNGRSIDCSDDVATVGASVGAIVIVREGESDGSNDVAIVRAFVGALVVAQFAPPCGGVSLLFNLILLPSLFPFPLCGYGHV